MSESEWKVWGVAEIGCWIAHFPDAWPTGHDAEDCIDAHIACNIRHLVWELGRSTLSYHSHLPGATCPLTRKDHHALAPQRRALAAELRRRCHLRAALAYGSEKGLTIYGRLCMNRHYRPDTPHRSEFAQSHPEWCEIGKDGRLDPTRLCYAIPEHRQERVAILREAAQIGCAGLCLDFCRQPPAVRYHPAFVNGHRGKTGKDARKLSLADKKEFLAWCQYRADSVTELLRELKDALDPVREQSGRKIPVQVRIPNDGFEANLIAGFDVKRWSTENLADELALSELHWLEEYREWDDKPYIRLGRETGVPVYASSSCLPMQAGGWSGKVNPKGVNPLVLLKRTLQSFEDGAQGICLYQSDTGVRWPGMPQALRAMSDETALRKLLADQEFIRHNPITPENEHFGIDNHSIPDGEFRFRAAAGEEAGGV